MAQGEAGGRESRRDFGNARGFGGDVVSGSDEPGETRRVGAGTNFGRTNSASTAKRAGTGKTGQARGGGFDAAAAHGIAPERSGVRELPQGFGSDWIWA